MPNAQEVIALIQHIFDTSEQNATQLFDSALLGGELDTLLFELGY